MGKGGRPRVENPKTDRVHFRVTPEDRRKLDEYCIQHHVSKSQVLMEGFRLFMEREEREKGE